MCINDRYVHNVSGNSWEKYPIRVIGGADPQINLNVIKYGKMIILFIKWLIVKYKNVWNEYIKCFYIILKCRIRYL